MKKAVWSGLIAAVGVMAMSTPVFAQSATSTPVNVTVNANVAAKAKLTVGPAAISFADADPDVTASLPASAPLAIDVKARTSTNGAVSLTVKAVGDLKSGATDTITIDKLTWTSGSTGFVGGTSSTAAAVPVASFTGSGQYSGQQNYALANSWAYATGNYSATLTYTLTAQ